MTEYAVKAPEPALLDINGSDKKFPVRRIYCIGKNYVAHIREMNADERDPPVIFMKPADAIVKNGGLIPYPIFTENFHYECELIVALKSGGYNISVTEAANHIFGYAVGLDMTRRDHQANVIAKGLPWEATKGFDHSAPVGPITPVAATGILKSGQIKLELNGALKQDSDISLMIWGIDEIISKLSEQYCLTAGDIIMTGTPAGVGAVVKGDILKCTVAGLEPLTLSIGAQVG